MSCPLIIINRGQLPLDTHFPCACFCLVLSVWILELTWNMFIKCKGNEAWVAEYIKQASYKSFMLKIGRICNLWNKWADWVFRGENVIVCTAFFHRRYKELKAVDQCIARAVFVCKMLKILLQNDGSSLFILVWH